jgi:hypothetical protein
MIGFRGYCGFLVALAVGQRFPSHDNGSQRRVLGTISAGWFPPFRSQGHQSDTGKWQQLQLASRLLKAWSISVVGVICGGSKKKDAHFRNLLTTSTCPKQSRKMAGTPGHFP